MNVGDKSRGPGEPSGEGTIEDDELLSLLMLSTLPFA